MLIRFVVAAVFKSYEGVHLHSDEDIHLLHHNKNGSPREVSYHSGICPSFGWFWEANYGIGRYCTKTNSRIRV